MFSRNMPYSAALASDPDNDLIQFLVAAPEKLIQDNRPPMFVK